MPKKEKERKGKKPKKKREKKGKSIHYSVSGETIERKKRFCPKCGAGVFMAEHRNRFTCGKCGYTEWKGK